MSRFEDLYTMMGISWMMTKAKDNPDLGLDIKQYILRNVIVSENRQFIQNNDVHKKYLNIKLSRTEQRKNTDEVIEKLKEYSYLIRKILSKKVFMKFLPKILFRKDESFEYAEKIENLIKQTNK